MYAYLDYNATTPVAEEVREAMMPWFSEKFWNASSAHYGGRIAIDAVESARQQVADLIGANPAEIVFTSQVEHKAVLDTTTFLSGQGIDCHLLPVNELGEVRIEQFSDFENSKPALVSFMAANNETGVITDLENLVGHFKENGALFHCDATQAVGKINFSVEHLNVDMASISGHKIYGPKGVGAFALNAQKCGISCFRR